MCASVILSAPFVLAIAASVARADGGTLRISERRDGRRISVFTTPTPLRAGLADISILVQDAATGKPLPEVPVMVSVHPAHNSQRKRSRTCDDRGGHQ